MTVTVITFFKPSDAYKANPHLGDAGIKVISDLEGIQACVFLLPRPGEEVLIDELVGAQKLPWHSDREQRRSGPYHRFASSLLTSL
jgi:hypothetical protein